MRIYRLAQVNRPVYRYTDVDGTGLLNNTAIDLMKLTDEEELELLEVMALGLEQPPSEIWNVRGIFYFTEEGLQRHVRLIELLSKASKKGVLKSKAYYTGEPIWESSDGQVYLRPEQLTQVS